MQRLRWSMRSGASGVACLDAPFNVSAARAREYRLFSVLSIICASCERAPLDAPETIDDQKRCTGCRYRTICGGSRGSASLPFYVRRQIAQQCVPFACNAGSHCNTLSAHRLDTYLFTEHYFPAL